MQSPLGCGGVCVRVWVCVFLIAGGNGVPAQASSARARGVGGGRFGLVRKFR